MSFLEQLASAPIVADCETCPVPHSVCEFTGCPTCSSCPTAIAMGMVRATAVLAYQRQTFSAKARGW